MEQPTALLSDARMQRLWSSIDITGVCWEWTGPRAPNGYGKFCTARRQYVAHRLVWRVLVGDIPPDLEADHRCRNRACVNPDHIELVSHDVNMARGNTHGRETHCPQGHPYSGANLKIERRRDGGVGRRCRVCSNTRDRLRRRRLRQERQAAAAS